MALSTGPTVTFRVVNTFSLSATLPPPTAVTQFGLTNIEGVSVWPDPEGGDGSIL